VKLDGTAWAALCQGQLTQAGDGRPLNGVSIDTRTTTADNVFVAIKGPRFDGHDFLADAVKRGAAAVVIHRSNAAKGLPQQVSVIQVDDTLKALQRAAKSWRQKMSAQVIGITGSNGKTTTKEMLASVLSGVGPTLATAGNFNNHIGLPLTLLRLTPAHRFAVIEMGSSMPGDMDPLIDMTQADVALMTNVGHDHLEFFGTPEGVLKENWKLYAALSEKQTAIINDDDPLIAGKAGTLRCRSIHYSMDAAASVHARQVESTDQGVRFTLSIAGKENPATLPIPGKMQVMNALAAAAAASAVGATMDQIVTGLARFKSAAMRMEIHDWQNRATLVNDAYNANPSSMEASISSFCESFAKQPLWLVLGDMRELGPTAREAHRALGKWLAHQPLAGVFLYGRDTRFIEMGLKTARAAFSVERYRKKRYLLQALRERLTSGHPAVLFKASRRMRLETLVKDLLN
jgi:UDP-N-acetylmuramoyl-tripeptide--D-alanyl-D-alanine ligase